MYYIDLVSLLKAFGTKGIEKAEVYGRIVRQLPKPSNILSDVKMSSTAIFVEMEVFAVNLKYHESYLKQNGVYNSDGIYMVNGSLITFIEPRNQKLPEWYTIRGTLRFGTKDISRTYVAVFNYFKNNNEWNLGTCNTSDIDISGWTDGTDLKYWINSSWQNSEIMHPQYVKSLPRFNSFIPAKAPITSLASSLQEAENGVSIKYPTTTTPKFKKECRTDVKDANELYDKFSDSLEKAKSTRLSMISDLKNDFGLFDTAEYLDYMLRGLLQYLKSKPSPYSMTGRMLLSNYLSNFKHSSDEYISDMTVSEYLVRNFDEVAEYIKENKSRVNCDGVAWDVCRHAFGNSEYFYAGIVALLVGIPSDEMLSVAQHCVSNEISIIQILNENPYVLQYMSSFNFSTVERLALFFGKHLDTTISEHRDCAMLNDFINGSSDSSTYYTKDFLANADVGIKITKNKYNSILENGTPLTIRDLQNIKAYLHPKNLQSLGYNTQRFKPLGSNYYIERLTGVQLLNAIKNYENSGLGLIVDKYISSTSLVEKELFVYKAMHEMACNKYNYSTADIDKYIAEYEKIVGFRLEERQRMAVHLIVNGAFVVAGSAGSGKTTVSNCIVYVLSKLDPKLDIQFAAPTGKAAKRMQEVVKQEVKTFHSKFKIGLGFSSGVFEDNLFTDKIPDVAYFGDEGAMLTIDLLYKVLKSIDIKTCRFILFGDFHQLPPIGKGLPFKNLLRFMPCVFLNVSKRAADGSNITANSNYINEYSDTGNWKPLQSGDDFWLLDCKTTDIARHIQTLCAYYLGKNVDITQVKSILGLSELPKVDDITADDIQVVTPFAKESYSWGSYALNKILQPLFNPFATPYNTFYYRLSDYNEGVKFIIGDRVIHTISNMYNMQWYEETKEEGKFRKVFGCGICNGEVGKVKGFYCSKDVKILNEEGNKPDGFEYPENLRDDNNWFGEEQWFVAVEYYDYISDENFIILYRAELNTLVNSNTGIVFKGEDLGKLNLFYAGTTHKLQGSQAKIIICPFGDINYRGFVTREMVYTMFTRGVQLVFGVGSVSNSMYSTLSKARQDIASQGINTIGELLI